jgi:hypothetical protein
MSRIFFIFLILPVLFFVSCRRSIKNLSPEISGDLIQWHKIALLITGPGSGENDSINPFLRYRLNVTFTHQQEKFVVPGFYAADGDAAETGADHGDKWKVIFRPDNYGLWNYTISFREGTDIAVSDEPEAGQKIFSDGIQGQFTILPADDKNQDSDTGGRVAYTGDYYLHYSGTGKPFLKGGADSPENFLGYQDFDGTYYGGWNDTARQGEAEPDKSLHRYEPHEKDWRTGDPSWRNGKGKGIIGALNYLSSKGINSVYMLTNNVGGDGKDVFPWTTYNSDFTRFDVSKLEQWEIVFDYMDKLGMMCHFVTQENENQLMLDSGRLGLNRKLYYRELIARFSHHLAVTWNMGEENGVSSWNKSGQTGQQQREMANYFKTHDPYQNFVVIHTHSGEDDRNRILSDLLGFPSLDGPSLQTNPDITHTETLKWRRLSGQKGRKWVVCSDEIGPADTGAKPDAYDPMHNSIRHEVLWGNLMAGGSGVEWYFGYNYPNNDLTCEDFRSRENLWTQTNFALQFFKEYIPINTMIPADSLVQPEGVYCMASPAGLYAVYIPEFAECTLHVAKGNSIYYTGWYDPVRGGEMTAGDTILADIKGTLNITPFKNLNRNQDWAVLVKFLK